MIHYNVHSSWCRTKTDYEKTVPAPYSLNLYLRDSPSKEENRAASLEEVKGFVEKVGYPVLVRPSYVLSGAAMNVCYDDEELENFLKMAAEVSKEYPVVVSQFLENTKEIEFDAVAQNGEEVEYAISEHVEFAGVHSGDATLVFPAQKIYFATARRIKKISRQIAKELNISGPFNKSLAPPPPANATDDPSTIIEGAIPLFV